MPLFPRCLPVFALIVVVTPAFAPGQTKPVDPEHAAKMAKGTELFKATVRGVLQTKCVKCHSGDRVEGEFDLGTREGLLKGGGRGPAVVPGEHAKSLLYQLTAYLKEPHMPHERAKLPAAEIAKLAEWIDLGAPYDRPFVEVDDAAWTKKVVPPEAKNHWAFRPLARDVRPPLPDARHPVDSFLLAKLRDNGLSFNPPADRRTLIRRVYLDLIGLPPTPAQVEAFLKDESPRAFEAVVDALLASPHFGEKQARHWLDLVRFAESHGFEHDYDRPTAYHYRDFVIKALNQDLPFDTFAAWQLAGDELAPHDPLALMATGYLAAGVHSTQITKNEVERHRYDELDDMLGNVGTTFLGLTVGCARCHDHKFDAVPARDYYRMLSAFTTTVRTELNIDLDPAGYAQAKAAFDAEHRPFLDALTAFEAETLPGRFAAWEAARGDKPVSLHWLFAPVRVALAVPAADRTPAQAALALKWFARQDPDWRKLAAAERDHAAKAPKPSVVKALISSEGLPPVRLHTQGADFLKETHFLRRGDPAQKAGEAPVSFLQVLMPDAESQVRWVRPAPAGSRTTFRRASFAAWLTDTQQGAGHLVARVIVNRLWQQHFGRGIVPTVSDFGVRGEPPSHPELLDFLAAELIRGGWKLKPIHKLLVTSAAYQQSAARDEAKAKADAENKLVGRYTVRRLQAEVIRDSILFVGGTLDATMYGPGTLDESSKRRSVYFTMKRSKLIPSLVVFDAPDGTVGVGDRPATTIAPQALHLMNSPQVRAAAKGFARRVLGDGTVGDAGAVRTAYRMALCREPTADELADGVAFLKGNTGPAREAALTDFCQVLFCLNEFLYVE